MGGAVDADILADSDHIYDSAVWLDKTVQQSFISYYASVPKLSGLCYMSGTYGRLAKDNPVKIRHKGDQTKLISANDDSNFSYRGRFNTRDKKTGYNEALSIGYEASQKSHNALKWIIRRQGFTRDGVCVATWENTLNSLPNFYESAIGIMTALPEDADEAEFVEDLLFQEDGAVQSDTNYASATDFNAALDGYASKLSDTSKMVVIALDGVSTKGRLAITYYKELDSSCYLSNIRLWHESCCWKHEYIKDKKLHGYEGMASIRDVATAVYGTEQGKDKGSKRIELRKNSDGKCPMLISAFDRLRPCIIDGATVPVDMVRAAVLKASNPLAYEVKFNYTKVLHVACSLVKRLYWEKKKRNEPEGVILGMKLDSGYSDRSYLYGRLLAIAEDIERRTYDRDETRVTNAERYMQAFVQDPFRTWPMIQRNIKPYLNSLKPGSRKFYKDLFGEITELFADGDFEARAALNGKYLIGYDCQRTVLQTYQTKGKSGQEENKTVNIEEEE